jgi:hypothetical protein
VRLFLLVVLLAGCASAPTTPPPGDYTIPVIKGDGSVQTFTVEPDGSKERMLFCIEGAADVLCVAEENGRALRYRIPLLQDERPERGT